MQKNIKLFLVANSEYDDSNIQNLNGVKNSADIIYEFFKNNVCESGNIEYLQNTDNKILRKSLIEFLKKINENDIFMFYFCGHGYLTSSDRSELLMATTDTSPNNLPAKIGLPFSVLADNIREFSVKKSIIIIDSCYSGAILNSNENKSVLISSSDTLQTSLSTTIDNTEHSIFSYYFGKSLYENNKNEFCLKSINEIYYQTKKHIENNTKSSDKMTPHIKGVDDLADLKIIPCPASNKNSIYQQDIPIIDWRITSSCSNNCGFCYALNDCNCNDISNDKKAIDKVISTIDNLKCKSICITGGEPTLCNNLEYILKELYNRNHSIYLSTNGENYMDKKDIDKYLDKLSLPLDGYNSETNKCNGRNENSFDKVIKILEYYTNMVKNTNFKLKFKIKISTLLTKNNYSIEHFTKMFQLLNKYPIIYIWKIYEFIPESRGYKNRGNYEITEEELLKLENKLNELSVTSDFKIELIKRFDRNSAYFIIQPDSTVVIPKETENDNVDEVKIGNLLTGEIDNIKRLWMEEVDYNNYIDILRVRDFNKVIILNKVQEKILTELANSKSIVSIKTIGENIHKTYGIPLEESTVDKELDFLFNLRIIRDIIPIVNLKVFKLNTYLVTLNIKKNGNLSQKHIADILCYNKQVGWVSEFENGNFRIAIFAKSDNEAFNIIDEIRDLLCGDLLNHETQLLDVSYSIGEARIFSSTTAINNIEFGPQPTNLVKLTSEEFDLLKNIIKVDKLIKENISNQDLQGLEQLCTKNVLDKIHTVLDTKLIGYDWYLISITKKAGKRSRTFNKKDFFAYLEKNFKFILTHVNDFAKQLDSNKCILDFEVHVKSYAEFENLKKKLNNDYRNVNIKYEKIIQEHKFKFTTETVMNELKKYTMVE